MRCKYCRTEYVGTKCPSCGGTSSSKKSSTKINNNSNLGVISSLFSQENINSIKTSSSNNSFPYSNLIYKSKSIAYSIRFVFRTWIICIILGLILSHYMKDGSIAFIEENIEILGYVKIALLYFGWLIGIVLMRLRRILRRII